MDPIEETVFYLKPFLIFILYASISALSRIATYQFNYNYDDTKRETYYQEKIYIENQWYKWLWKVITHDIFGLFFPPFSQIQNDLKERKSKWVLLIKYGMGIFCILFLIGGFFKNLQWFSFLGPYESIIHFIIGLIALRLLLSTIFFLFEYFYLKFSTLINIVKLSNNIPIEIDKNSFILWNEDTKTDVNFVTTFLKIWFLPYSSLSDKVNQTFLQTKIQYTNIARNTLPTATSTLRDIFEYVSSHSYGLLAIVYLTIFMMSMSNSFHLSSYLFPSIEVLNPSSTNNITQIMLRMFLVSLSSLFILGLYILILWIIYTLFHYGSNKLLKSLLSKYQSEEYEKVFTINEDFPDGKIEKKYDFSTYRQLKQMLVYTLKRQYIPHVTVKDIQLDPSHEHSMIDDTKVLDIGTINRLINNLDIKKSFRKLFLGKISLSLLLIYLTAFLIVLTFAIWYESNPFRYQNKKNYTEKEIEDGITFTSHQINQRSKRYTSLMETMVGILSFIFAGLLIHCFYKQSSFDKVKDKLEIFIILLIILCVLVYFLFY